MPKTRSRLVRYGFLAGLTAAVFAGGAFVLTLGSDDLATVAAEQAVNAGPDKVAIKGYDPVAYFTEGRAVRGSPEFEHDWHGATWRFASAAHRDAFAADPDRYAPQYGGFCSLGVQVSKAWDVDPEAWTIIDGKLYFAYDQESIEDFERNAVANVDQADEVWRSVVVAD